MSSCDVYKTETDLLSLFECPVCLEYALPPIHQCKNGHIICDGCRVKFSACPTCRVGPCLSRNLALEKFAATLSFPCRYAASGCKKTIGLPEKSAHELICDFKPYKCPCPGTSCKWIGSLEQVILHLSTCHKSITTLQGDDIVFLATDINLSGAVDWVMMQSCYGFTFILVLEKHATNTENQLFHALVQIIGTPKQAEQFFYRLQLNQGPRRLTWEASPRSIQDGVQAAIACSDCLIFDAKMAGNFSDNGNLCINVTISRLGAGNAVMPAASLPAPRTEANNALAVKKASFDVCKS